MSSTSIFKVLKPIVYSMVDKNGNFRTTFIGVLKDKDPRSDNMVALKFLIQILLNSDYISEASKMYISDRDITASSIASDLNDRNSKGKGYEVTVKDISNRLYREQDKIVKNIVSSNELYDIVYNDASPSKMVERLTKEVSKKNKKSSEIVLDIPNDIIYSECDDDIFDDFLNKIRPYSKKYIENVCRQLPEAAIGYYNYIMNNPCLSEKDKQIKDHVMQLFNNCQLDNISIDVD